MDKFSEREDQMMFYAFRYCLGRMTYAVDDCARYLIANWDRLSENSQKLIVKEINEALEKAKAGHPGYPAGHQCDIDSWTRVLERANQ